MNNHGSIDSGLYELESLNQHTNQLRNVEQNGFQDNLFQIDDSAIDLRFHSHSENRNKATQSRRCLDLAWFWLLFIPALLLFVCVVCNWLLMAALLASGLCWWPFCILAASDTVHILTALVFIRLKTANSDSVTASPPIYAGLLIVVHLVAFVVYILCISLEAPAQCFSTSFKKKLAGQTVNASIGHPHTSTNLSILFPLYREFATFVSYKSEQSPSLKISQELAASKSSVEVSNVSVELTLIAFILLDFLARTSTLFVFVLETCAAHRLHSRSRPLYSAVRAQFAGNSQDCCFTSLALVCWSLAMCVWAFNLRVYKPSGH